MRLYRLLLLARLVAAGLPVASRAWSQLSRTHASDATAYEDTPLPDAATNVAEQTPLSPATPLAPAKWANGNEAKTASADVKPSSQTAVETSTMPPSPAPPDRQRK